MSSRASLSEPAQPPIGYVPMPSAPATSTGNANAPQAVPAPDLVAPPVTSTPDIRPERSARPTGREEPSR